MILWGHPWALLLLALCPLLWWKKLRRSESRTSPFLRSTLGLLFVLAWADPVWQHPGEHRSLLVLAATDLPAAAEWRAHIEARAPRHSSLVWRQISPLELSPEEGAALIGEAVSLSPDTAGRVLLLADEDQFFPTHPLARRARGANPIEPIVIDSALLPRPAGQPRDGESLGLVSYFIPEHLREGERFPLRAGWSAKEPGTGIIRIYQQGLLAAEEEVTWTAGETVWRTEKLVAAGPWMRLEWRLDLAPEVGDHPPSPNLAHHGIYAVDGPPRLLVLADPQENLSALLRAWQDEDWQVRQEMPSALRGRASDWAADLLVLGSSSTEALTPAQWAEIRRWVHDDGGALLFLGGPSAWPRDGVLREAGAGLSPLLPRPLEEKEKGAQAVLVVLDRSGSMNLPVGGFTKMALANEGTVQVLQTLGAEDFFGVLAVDVAVDVVLPLEAGHERGTAAEVVRNIGVGGGGIYAYPALLESWRRLRSSPARTKHLILFADADDVEEKFEGQTTGRTSGADSLDLATTMRGAGITISVVALGEETDKDVRWLRELARRGEGRFSLTNNPADLPRLFLETAEELRPGRGAEDTFFVRPSAVGEVVFPAVNWAEAPPLLGANEVEAQPGAQIWLWGEKDQPLLAQWNLGAGQAATFASSPAGFWSSEWLAWPQYATFWQQLARTLAAPGLQESWMISAHPRTTDILRITARRIVGEEDIAPEFPPWLAKTEDGTGVSLPWQLLAPGVFVAEEPLPPSALLFHPEVGVGKSLARPWVWNPGPPAEAVSARETLADLSLRTGGRRLDTPTEAWDFPAERDIRSVPLRPWLLALAAFLLPVAWLRLRTHQQAGT